MVTRAWIASVLLLITITQSHAFCSQPRAPHCASSFGSFDDRYEFERCKHEMEHYRDDLDRYLSCLRNDREQAVRDYHDAVESFKRRARG
jgi:hypothetical protein